MTMVTVERPVGADGLMRHVWRFWFWGEGADGPKLVLDTFTSEQRWTRRHKWVVNNGWARLSHMRRDLGVLFIERDKVPLPKEVAQHALDTFVHLINVEGL